jgi:hypothetical protein
MMRVILEKLIPDSIHDPGRDSDDAKEEKLISFTQGKSRSSLRNQNRRRGLNWQIVIRCLFPYSLIQQIIRGFAGVGVLGRSGQ